jgi:hypothetical protein
MIKGMSEFFYNFGERTVYQQLHKIQHHKEKLIHSYICIFLGVEVFLFFIFYFIHMYIQCLGNFSPLPPTPSLSPPTAYLPGRNYFALISNFVEERV